MQRRRACDQPDLFQVHQPKVQRGVIEGAKLLPLLRSLLLEIVFDANEENSGKEGDHE